MEVFKKEDNYGSFESLVKLINESNDDGLIEQAKLWMPNIEKYDIDYWVDNIFSDNIKRIDFNKLPIVLDVFYKSNDKFTFMIFCMILESTIDELPYLTNLEKERLFVAKWETLKTTVASIIKNSNSALIDCMFLILLNNDPRGNYLTIEEKNDVIEGINSNLHGICNYLSNSKTINPDIYKSIEVILDASTYLNNEKTIELVNQISKLSLNDESLIFLLKCQLVNGIDIDMNNIEKILNNKPLNYKLFHVLDSVDKLNILEGKINQDDIATSKMIEWLIYPAELGQLPTDIKIIDTIEKDDLVYYLFKFSTDLEKFREKGYMIGVVGGYQKNKLTTSFSGVVFSEYEKVEDDYKMQGLKLIELIENYWKNRNS